MWRQLLILATLIAGIVLCIWQIRRLVLRAARSDPYEMSRLDPMTEVAGRFLFMAIAVLAIGFLWLSLEWFVSPMPESFGRMR